MRLQRLLAVFVLASVVSPAAILASTARELRGCVLSSEGKAVSGAVVLHRASGVKTQTGEDGGFLLRLETRGRIDLEIIHPDYHEEFFSVPEERPGRPLRVVLTPYIKQREEIVVTALRYPEPSLNVPATGSVVSGEALSEGGAPHLAAGVEHLPGVSLLGAGGFSMVPVIRGLSRNRILFLVDAARITSDRRTGPNASFVSPEDMARVEVLRSASSVFYGSDAVGGVFQVFLKEPDPRQGIHGRVLARYGTGNDEKGLGAALSGRLNDFGFYLSLQGVDAGDYRNAEGIVPRSGFSQWSLTAKASYRTEKRRVELSVLRSRGRDIGKPSRDSLVRPTWYPREDQNIAQIHWSEKDIAGGELSFNAFVNPNALETRTDRYEESQKTKESASRSESRDFGIQLAFTRRAAGPLRIHAGLDVGGRAAAGAVNRDVSFDAQGRVTATFEERPYADGSRKDAGIFLSLDLPLRNRWDIVGGVRWDRLRIEADPGGTGRTVVRTDSALSGFGAASCRLSEHVVVFANISRAYRAPTLSEMFYTGITGRGFIVSQPGLAAEKSVNADAGFKVVSSRVFAAVYGFRYDIDGLIDRYRIDERTTTYGNVDRGRIEGVEAEAEWFPRSGLKLFGNISHVRGRSVLTNGALNDIPPIKLLAGVRIWVGRFSCEASLRHQGRKPDPGPAERPLPACTLADLKMNLYLPPSFQVNVAVNNVFDALVLSRPDPDAPPDPGRRIHVGLVYSF